MQKSQGEHYFSEEQNSRLRHKKISARFFGRAINLITASGVFSVGKVDKGTQALLKYCIIKDGWDVLDLGCGYGAAGIAVACGFSDAKVVMTDVNKRAVKTARLNAKENRVENCSVRQGNSFDKIKKEELFDAILFNPPQTAGKELCNSMIQKSKEYLKKGGILQIVARHNKGGKEFSKVIKETFGNVEVLGIQSGYRVYAGRKK